MDPLDERDRHDVHRFEQHFAEWLRLRAELQHASLVAEVDEARYAALELQLGDTERLVMTTRAPVSWIIWKKFEVLEQILVDEDGTRGDRAEVWMLAGIKADLLALGTDAVAAEATRAARTDRAGAGSAVAS